MRDYLLAFVNGKPHRISGEHAFWTLSKFLRQHQNLVGTKVMCAEGDCGACSVLVGRLRGPDDTLAYHAVDSCIVFMHQLDGAHIVTVEGLGTPDELSDVQRAMVECHGSQCGYCTPGFVVAMHGLVEEDQESIPASCQATGRKLSDASLRLGLSGNLCRCTGYVQILDAGKSINCENVPRLNDRFPPAEMIRTFEAVSSEPAMIRTNERSVCVPSTLEQALQHKQRLSDCRVVSGATDLGVQHNHGTTNLDHRLCLSKVRELRTVESGPAAIRVGSCVTWTELLKTVREPFPQFAEILERFGSPQIRNIGSIGGNLANASPIADSIPFLFAIQASLRLVSLTETRTIEISDFYLDYKKIDLRPDELIHSIEIPLPHANDRMTLLKVSRRRDMDISTMTAAIRLRMDGELIRQAWIALGGVGPVVRRVPDAERVLAGKPLDLDVMKEAGELAVNSIAPISDVRGSKTYRQQLSQNVFAKCFYELTNQDHRVSA